MDVADTSRIIKTKERNHRKARNAYDTVIRLFEKPSPDVAQREEIDLQMATLKKRLVAGRAEALTHQHRTALYLFQKGF